MQRTAKETRQSPLKILGMVIAGFIGWVLGGYAPLPVIVTTIFTVGVHWITRKAFGETRALALAFAVQAGLGFWLAATLAHMAFLGLWGSEAYGGILHLAMVSAGLAWLFTRRSVASMVFMLAVQAFALLMNGVVFCLASVGTPTHRLSSVYVAFRAMAVFGLLKAIHDHHSSKRLQAEAFSGKTGDQLPASTGDQPNTGSTCESRDFSPPRAPSQSVSGS